MAPSLNFVPAPDTLAVGAPSACPPKPPGALNPNFGSWVTAADMGPGGPSGAGTACSLLPPVTTVDLPYPYSPMPVPQVDGMDSQWTLIPPGTQPAYPATALTLSPFPKCLSL